MTLPRINGESAVLWSDGESRIRIECHGEAWSLHSEYSDWVDDEGAAEHNDGGVPLGGWRDSWWTRLALDLREFNNVGAQMLRMMTKGSVDMPAPRKPVKVARASGWWVQLTDEGGSDEPLIGISMKRPLVGEEMLAFLGRFTKWLDAREKDS